MAATLKKKPGSKTKSAGKPAADMRPLHEANYQKEQLRAVFKYLVTHECSFPVSVTQLQTLGRGEIWATVTFLLQKVNSEKTVRSFTDLAPVAKDLGYPFSVASSNQANNHLLALGFLFWLHEVVRLLEREEEECDAMTEYMLSSYTQYMEKRENDGLDRRRLFLAMRQRQGSGEEKRKLQQEIIELETVRGSGPSEQLEHYEQTIERLETDNQSYLMEVIAPLDERRSQIKAAVSQPSVSDEEILRSETATARLEVQCEALSAQYTEGMSELAEAGLADASEGQMEELLREAEDSRQELEFEDLRLRAEVDIWEAKKSETLTALESLRRKRQEEMSSRMFALQETYSEARSCTETLEATLAAEKQQLSWERAEAEQALRRDLQWISQLLSAC